MKPSSPVPISKRIVLINSASGVVTHVLTVGVFAWVIQYLLKRIPEQEMALLPIVMSLAMILPLLQTILTGGLSRFVTDAYARNDLDGVTRIVSSQFPLLLVGGILMLLLGGTIAWNIEHVLTIPPDLVGKARFMMLLVVGRMCIGFVLTPFNTGLFAQQRFVVQNSIEVAGSLVRIVLTLFFILGIGPNVEWVVLAQIVSQLFVQIFQTVVSMWHMPALRYKPGHFEWATCRKVLTFSGWNFAAQAASMIRRAADAPILNQFSTAVAVNDFFLGSIFDTKLREFTIKASQSLLPAFTAMHAQDQHQRLAAAYLRGGRIAMWVAMLVGAPLIVFSYDLFSLYLGSAYRDHVDAATVMILLLLALPFLYPTTMLTRISFARGDIRSIAIRSIAAQLVNLALTLLFVGYFHTGAVGSATATIIAAAVAEPLLFWPLALRTLDLSWSRFIRETLVPGLFPAVAAGCAGLISARLFGDTAVMRIVVGVPVCLVVYAIAVFFSLRPADRADLGRIRKLVRI